MTPAGHLAVSYIAGASNQRILLPAVLAGGVLPDCDFIFFFFAWFNEIHRLISHNVTFVLLASLIAAGVAPRGIKAAAAVSLLLGGAAHLLIDSVMDVNPTNGIGIALFWPFSSQFYSPFNLMQASADMPGWSQPAAMMRVLVPGMLYEVPFYMGALLLWKGAGRAASKGQMRAVRR